MLHGNSTPLHATRVNWAYDPCYPDGRLT